MTRSQVVVAIALLFASVANAQLSRTFVASSGSDANDCSRANPCRSFSAAIANTSGGGEIVALDSAGFGPSLTITRSVSVIAPTGIYAGMTATSGTAITVNAPASTVVLRGLYLNSVGATTGISITSNTSVHIEHVVVNGFSSNGIEVTGSGAFVFVDDSVVRENGQSGIFAAPQSGAAFLSIEHVHLEENQYGLSADSGTDITIRDTVAFNTVYSYYFRNAGSLLNLLASVEHSTARGGGVGFYALNGAHVSVRDSAAVRTQYAGFVASGLTAGVVSEMTIDHCLAAENLQHGVVAGGTSEAGSGIITISNSMVERNGSRGILAASNGTIRAFDNTVTKNAIGLDGSFGNFRTGGHNFVDGNDTETSGAINPVPTM